MARDLAMLALLLAVGCFDPSATLGSACDRSSDCGSDQRCRHGLCGRCGDGRRQVGETCFDAPESLAAVGPDARMIIADVAGDGQPDVVVIGARALRWWQSTAMSDPVVLTLADEPTAVAVGDIDGTAPREIVVGDASSLTIVAAEGTTLAPTGSISVASDVRDVAVLERADGAARIAWTAGGQTGAIEIVEASGAPVDTIAVGPWPWFVTTLDHDGDAWLDLAVTVGAPVRLWILRGDPSGLLPGPSVGLAAMPVAIAPFDRDRDGHPGFAVLFDDGGLALVESSREGDLLARDALTDPLALVEPRAIAVLDADVDGLLDLLVGGRDELRLLPSQGGSFDFDVAFADRGASTLAVATLGPLPIADLFALRDGVLVRMRGER